VGEYAFSMELMKNETKKGKNGGADRVESSAIGHVI